MFVLGRKSSNNSNLSSVKGHPGSLNSALGGEGVITVAPHEKFSPTWNSAIASISGTIFNRPQSHPKTTFFITTWYPTRSETHSEDNYAQITTDSRSMHTKSEAKSCRQRSGATRQDSQITTKPARPAPHGSLQGPHSTQEAQHKANRANLSRRSSRAAT